MLEQITYFFMAYTALIVISSVMMIYTSVVHLSSYTSLRDSIFIYIRHRMKSENHRLGGWWTRLTHLSYTLGGSSSDPATDQEVFYTSGGSRQDFHAINRQVRKSFNTRALEIISKPTQSARDIQRIQKQLFRAAQKETFSTLKDQRVQKFLITYFVRLLDTLGRSAAAGFILSSLIISAYIFRTGEFNAHSGPAFTASFISSSIFGTIFVVRNYPKGRRTRGALYLIIPLLILASWASWRVFN